MNCPTSCSSLADRTDFASYVQEIQNVTGNNFTLASSCKLEICNGIWGVGNPDIAGIGLIVGYIIQSALGFLFAIAIFMFRWSSITDQFSQYRKNLFDSQKEYFSCAVFFTAAIQIACVAVIVRKDFGISADGLGGLTVEVCWAVALLTMLPLVYSVFIPSRSTQDSESENGDPYGDDSSGLQFFLFSICWMMYFYTFVSRMIDNYANQDVTSRTGDDGMPIISAEEWSILGDICLSGVEELSDKENTVVNLFGIAGSIIISVLTVGRLLVWVLDTCIPSLQDNINKSRAIGKLTHTIIPWGLMFLIPIIGVVQIWAVIRLKSTQESLANSSGNPYADNHWAFGQIVAVVSFAPVLVEFGKIVKQRYTA
ncbi:MAG: hypothetical protein M1829_002374 [Trizodia sp. TS-e1964]|nr:MAG: hypothetical protein M1829_002374 [Trizodia sp. TS-e1964]